MSAPPDDHSDQAYARAAARDEALLAIERLAKPWQGLADDAWSARLRLLEARLDGKAVNANLDGPIGVIHAIAAQPAILAERATAAIDDPSPAHRRALANATSLPEGRIAIDAPAERLGPLGLILLEHADDALSPSNPMLRADLDVLSQRLDDQLSGRVPFPSSPMTAAERQQVFREQLLIGDITDRLEPVHELADRLSPSRFDFAPPPHIDIDRFSFAVSASERSPGRKPASLIRPQPYHAANQNLPSAVAEEPTDRGNLQGARAGFRAVFGEAIDLPPHEQPVSTTPSSPEMPAALDSERHRLMSAAMVPAGPPACSADTPISQRLQSMQEALGPAVNIPSASRSNDGGRGGRG